MIRGLLGKKIGMSQIFDDEGNIVPVSVVEAGPCFVLALIDGSVCKKIKIGFDPVKESRLKKPELGFLKKINVTPIRYIREFESTDNRDYQVGQQIKVDIFRPGDFVDVTGFSKGKGFQGGMKRWNWDGGPKTHGSMHHRRIGSIGSNTTPGRTNRGKTMPGHMGDERVTTQGLRVIQVDLENNLLLVKGAVPGGKNALLMINLSKKRVFRVLGEKVVTEAKKRNPMKQSKAKVKGK